MKLVLPFSFLIIAISIFFLVIAPVFGDIKDLNSNKLVYNDALNNSIKLKEIQDSLLAKYKNIKQEDKEKLNHFLPTSVNDIGLILEIEKIANTKGIPVRDIIFETKKAEEKDAISSEVKTIKKKSITEDQVEASPYETFKVEFTVDTTYDNFVIFLRDLEYNLRLIDIKSISFSVPEKSDKIPTGGVQIDKVNSSIYSYKLMIETYWFQ